MIRNSINLLSSPQPWKLFNFSTKHSFAQFSSSATSTLSSKKKLSTLVVTPQQATVGTEDYHYRYQPASDTKIKPPTIIPTFRQQTLSKQPSLPSTLSSLKDHEYRLRRSEDHLEVTWPDGSSFSFLNEWLRDNCLCSRCLHPETQQRQYHTATDPKETKLLNAKIAFPGGETSLKQIESVGALELEWEGGHKSQFPLSFLHSIVDDYLRNQSSTFQHSIDEVKPGYWNQKVINQKGLPEFSYDALVSSEESDLEWLEKLDKFGFVLVRDVPPSPEHTRKLAEKISYLRSTIFGTFWDYTISSSEAWKLQHSDTAYTNLTIKPHTDGSYYSDSPGLQFFHVLEFDRTSGGETILVDGFQLGEVLKRENPDAFKFLSEVPLYFRYNEKDKINIMSPNTVFKLNADGEYVQFRYNNHDRAPNYLPLEKAKRYYTSIRALLKEIDNPENQIRFVLQPGTVLVTNNWRILHAREEFVGTRRICGCYIGYEDYQSRMRVLRGRATSSLLKERNEK